MLSFQFSDPAGHFVLWTIYQGLQCLLQLSLVAFIYARPHLGGVEHAWVFRHSLIEQFHDTGITRWCFREALPDLSPTIAAPREQRRRLERTVFDRIEAKFCFALLA